MSIVALSSGEPTCTIDDVEALCKANNFALPSSPTTREAFLLFANSFDATCQAVNDLPVYEDPRLAPVAVQGGERVYTKPEDNPLNGWSHKGIFVSADPASKNGLLVGRTIAFKDNVSIAGLPLGLGASPRLFKDGKHPISTIDAMVVRRTLEAGGTVTGTANCENLSMFALSYTSDSGVVHNAWLPGYATGGSSSGW